jgi:hypothetical protein
MVLSKKKKSLNLCKKRQVLFSLLDFSHIYDCVVGVGSAICEKCYHEGDHHKHEFVMYHSESGGCCDCGDKDAWKEEGFCKMHQVTNQISGHMPIHLYATTKHTGDK